MNPFEQTIEVVATELHKIIIEHGNQVEDKIVALFHRMEQEYGIPHEFTEVFKEECAKNKAITFDSLSDDAKEKMRKWALRLCNKYADYSP